jgi:hypothetical protein
VAEEATEFFTDDKSMYDSTKDGKDCKIWLMFSKEWMGNRCTVKFVLATLSV